jgi:hypothetical protein
MICTRDGTLTQLMYAHDPDRGARSLGCITWGHSYSHSWALCCRFMAADLLCLLDTDDFPYVTWLGSSSWRWPWIRAHEVGPQI